MCWWDLGARHRHCMWLIQLSSFVFVLPALTHASVGTLFSSPNLYAYYPAQETFASAASACVAWGGSLTSVLNPTELSIVTNFNTSSSDFKWIGLVRNRSSTAPLPFRWLDGSPFSYHNFPFGRPDDLGGSEDYVYQGLVASVSNGWDDDNGTSAFSYVCKRQTSRSCFSFRFLSLLQ
jgi:hypothetical protein